MRRLTFESRRHFTGRAAHAFCESAFSLNLGVCGDFLGSSSWKRSIEMPTVRNLSPLKSSGLVIGFLYQPSGCVNIGPYGKDTTFMLIDAYSLVSSSLPPPYLCQASSMLASIP